MSHEPVMAVGASRQARGPRPTQAGHRKAFKAAPLTDWYWDQTGNGTGLRPNRPLPCPSVPPPPSCAGHSMGGGAAALLTMILREASPAVFGDARCYAIACPSTLTLELAESEWLMQGPGGRGPKQLS